MTSAAAAARRRRRRAAAPAITLAARPVRAPLKKLTFAWNQNAFCLTPIVVAQERGF